MTQIRKWNWFFSVCLCLIFLLGGCGIPEDARLSGETRRVTDGMGHEVTVPVHPMRVVSVGVSTDDVLIPILGTKRIVAMSDKAPNLEKESKEIQGRISDTTESVICHAPDLVVVPSWQKAEYVDEIRSAGIPVYVYQMPTTAEGMLVMIHELAGVVGEEEKGNALARQTEDRLRRLDNFLETVPQEARVTCVFARPNGIGGGKGSTFDGLCGHAGIINGAVSYGLVKNDYAGREALISINPDVIFVPSDAYSKDHTNAQTVQQLREDPAFREVKAVKNHRIYVIDARWLMGYSQFMVNAMEAMAEKAYGYGKALK